MMKKLRNITLVAMTLLLGSQVSGQSSALVERVIEVQTAEKNPATARTILMNAAAEKASEELIREIIGEQKLQKNRSLINTKIIRKSGAFLPFSKAGELRPMTPEGFQMSVTLRANLDQLQALLLENGLFYDSDATPAALPVVRWQDRFNSKSFGWWMGSSEEAAKPFLAKQSRAFEKQLQDSFLKAGFFVLRPQAYHYDDMLDGDQRMESPSPDQTVAWAQQWNAQMVIQGAVQFAKGERTDTVEVTVRLSALQIQNGRMIAEVARSFETEPGIFEAVVDRKLKENLAPLAADLAGQVLEAWKQGTINSQLYRLKVAARMPLPVQESFKENLRTRVREIKSVRERLISSDSVVYEIESSLPPPEIAKKIGELDLPGLKLIPDSANEKELVLKVKR